MLTNWSVRRAGCLLVFLLFVALSYGFGSPFHYSDPIRFRVIDESNGKPLHGTAVLAIWWLSDSIGAGSGWVLHTAQAFADEKGEVVVRLPLRIRPPFQHFEWWDPILIIYKPGYIVARRDNILLGDRGYLGPWDSRSIKRRSFWNGKTIPLHPATVEQEFESLQYCLDQVSTKPVNAFPPKFTRFWEVLADGYRRLPASSRIQETDPQRVIDRRSPQGLRWRGRPLGKEPR